MTYYNSSNELITVYAGWMKNTPFIKDRSGNCAICGIWRQRLHRDHIIPKHKGGMNTLKNIQLICANCHQDKTSTELKEHYVNRKFSAEHRAKISAAQIGRIVPPEQRAKISASLTGKKCSNPWTPESRAKASTTRKAMYDSGWSPFKNK